jgi:hypothetical protein
VDAVMVHHPKVEKAVSVVSKNMMTHISQHLAKMDKKSDGTP